MNFYEKMMAAGAIPEQVEEAKVAMSDKVLTLIIERDCLKDECVRYKNLFNDVELEIEGERQDKAMLMTENSQLRAELARIRKYLQPLADIWDNEEDMVYDDR